MAFLGYAYDNSYISFELAVATIFNFGSGVLIRKYGHLYHILITGFTISIVFGILGIIKKIYYENGDFWYSMAFASVAGISIGLVRNNMVVVV